MQNRNKKVGPGVFYNLQNRVEITAPRTDTNKTPQAGENLDTILWFESMNS